MQDSEAGHAVPVLGLENYSAESEWLALGQGAHCIVHRCHLLRPPNVVHRHHLLRPRNVFARLL
jgi:hypothetical protein